MSRTSAHRTDSGRFWPLVVAAMTGLLVATWLWQPGTVTAVVGAVGVLALLWAARRTPGPRRVPWLLLAAGTAAWLAGDLGGQSALVADGGSGSPSALVTAAELTGSFLLALGLLGFGGRARRPHASIDTAVVIVGGAALAWYFLVVPLTDSGDLPVGTALVLGAFASLSLGLVALGRVAQVRALTCGIVGVCHVIRL